MENNDLPVVVTAILDDENRVSLSVGIRQTIPLGNYRTISPSLMVTQKLSPDVAKDKRALLNAVISLYETMKPSYGYLVLQEVQLAANMEGSSPSKVASDLLSLLATPKVPDAAVS